MTVVLGRGTREPLLNDLETSFMIAFVQGTLRELAAVAAHEPHAKRAKRLE